MVSAYYQSLLAEQNTESNIIDLQGLPKDFVFSALYGNAGKNNDFNIYSQQIAQGDKFVFVVPEYNGSFPGVLKAFIDGLEYPSKFNNKKVAMVGLSSGMQGSALALSHLTDILSYLGANLLGMRVKLPRVEANLKDGKITNDLYNQLLREQVDKLIKF
ncbi:NADPH-dependent fmn reductase [Microscilla marina ATCC 23134]|uniref:NADPH-dependent fmn reductase n=1 Tax=Microscilla marina ATCC 23134 TaxID=313606 RepID=A1ZF26_MICM2|nr:NADPH-dependent fmn reductase [Microscilla marina ATCC 23134]